MLHHLPIKKRYRISVFYALTLILYFAFFGPQFINSLSFPEWLIAPIMAFGSFVAGSTFLGGGSVAFPSLTKILVVEPILAKTFSLAIQSVGMTSASLYIISRVKYVSWNFIGVFVISTIPGLALSLKYLQHHIPSTDLRIGFTLFIFCFLCIYLWSLKLDLKGKSKPKFQEASEWVVVILSGFIGGVISGLIGSGADLVAFAVLSLYFRSNIKLATQTSVIVMASTSLIGISLQSVTSNQISNEVLALWYIAAPVVLIGAPIGAMFCRRVKPENLRVFILSIIVLEILTTLILVPIQTNRIIYYVLTIGVSLSFLYYLKHSSHSKHSA